jgi:hypothetical protein
MYKAFIRTTVVTVNGIKTEHKGILSASELNTILSQQK